MSEIYDRPASGLRWQDVAIVMVVISLLSFTVARLAVLGPRDAFGTRAPSKVAAPIADDSAAMPVAEVSGSEAGGRGFAPASPNAAPGEITENQRARDASPRGA